MTLLEFENSYRSRTPEETLEIIQPYIKHAGITRLADLTGLDNIGVPVYAAIRPRSKNLSTAQGKGLTHQLAQCSAYMEAIEHFYAETTPSELRGSYKELRKKYLCINPSKLPAGILQHEALEEVVFDWTRLKLVRHPFCKFH